MEMKDRIKTFHLRNPRWRNEMKIELTIIEIYWLKDLLAGQIHEGTDHMDELKGADLFNHNSYINALKSILKKIKG